MSTIYNARLFTPVADPFVVNAATAAYQYFENGSLRIDAGRVVAVGDRTSLPVSAADEVINLGPHKLLVPGFVDTHLHAPQLEMIGSYGGHLLEWLNRYTFPTEEKFADEKHAQRVAKALYEELLRHGTVAALIFSTTHTAATEAFLSEAERRGFRGIIGKTLMDRNAPAGLLQDADESVEESRQLIKRWHRRGILSYAITPRFAPTCSPRLLELAGELKKEFPDVYVHSHISENRAEIEWVRELFPEQPDYASVYDHFGLLSDRTVLAHGVHLSDREVDLLAERKSKIAHCPNSNLFLGSGLFPLKNVLNHGVTVGLGTDIGAGTTPSMFNAMADAYKVQQVRGVSLGPFELWYLATLGGARALSLESVTGSLSVGKDADFLILDLEATPLIALRTGRASSIEDLLAGLIFMGDDRLVEKTFIQGREVSVRGKS